MASKPELFKRLATGLVDTLKAQTAGSGAEVSTVGKALENISAGTTSLPERPVAAQILRPDARTGIVGDFVKREVKRGKRKGMTDTILGTGAFRAGVTETGDITALGTGANKQLRGQVSTLSSDPEAFITAQNFGFSPTAPKPVTFTPAEVQTGAVIEARRQESLAFGEFFDKVHDEGLPYITKGADLGGYAKIWGQALTQLKAQDPSLFSPPVPTGLNSGTFAAASKDVLPLWRTWSFTRTAKTRIADALRQIEQLPKFGQDQATDAAYSALVAAHTDLLVRHNKASILLTPLTTRPGMERAARASTKVRRAILTWESARGEGLDRAAQAKAKSKGLALMDEALAEDFDSAFDAVMETMFEAIRRGSLVLDEFDIQLADTRANILGGRIASPNQSVRSAAAREGTALRAFFSSHRAEGMWDRGINPHHKYMSRLARGTGGGTKKKIKATPDSAFDEDPRLAGVQRGLDQANAGSGGVPNRQDPLGQARQEKKTGFTAATPDNPLLQEATLEGARSTSLSTQFNRVLLQEGFVDLDTLDEFLIMFGEGIPFQGYSALLDRDIQYVRTFNKLQDLAIANSPSGKAFGTGVTQNIAGPQASFYEKVMPGDLRRVLVDREFGSEVAKKDLKNLSKPALAIREKVEAEVAKAIKVDGDPEALSEILEVMKNEERRLKDIANRFELDGDSATVETALAIIEDKTRFAGLSKSDKKLMYKLAERARKQSAATRKLKAVEQRFMPAFARYRQALGEVPTDLPLPVSSLDHAYVRTYDSAGGHMDFAIKDLLHSVAEAKGFTVSTNRFFKDRIADKARGSRRLADTDFTPEGQTFFDAVLGKKSSKTRGRKKAAEETGAKIPKNQLREMMYELEAVIIVRAKGADSPAFFADARHAINYMKQGGRASNRLQGTNRFFKAEAASRTLIKNNSYQVMSNIIHGTAMGLARGVPPDAAQAVALNMPRLAEAMEDGRITTITARLVQLLQEPTFARTMKLGEVDPTSQKSVTNALTKLFALMDTEAIPDVLIQTRHDIDPILAEIETQIMKEFENSVRELKTKATVVEGPHVPKLRKLLGRTKVGRNESIRRLSAVSDVRVADVVEAMDALDMWSPAQREFFTSDKLYDKIEEYNKSVTLMGRCDI